MTKKKLIQTFFGIAFFLFLIWIDRITKHLAVVHLRGQADYPIIKNVFVLRYLENRGAAFGILQGRQLILAVFTAVILLIIAYVYFRTPVRKRFFLLRIILVLIAGGAVGNMIDRISQGYVIDFFYFQLINFPIFNMADIYVVTAAVLLICTLFFIYKEKDLQELSDALRPWKKRSSKQ